MMLKPYLLSVLLVVAMPVSVLAEDTIRFESTPAQIRASQEQLKHELETKKGAYDHLSDAEKAKILQKQQTIYQLIDGKNTIESINQDDQRRLMNTLEEVKSLVAQADDSRMICERVKVIGSNRPQSKCMTVGDRRRQRERLQEQGPDIKSK